MDRQRVQDREPPKKKQSLYGSSQYVWRDTNRTKTHQKPDEACSRGRSVLATVENLLSVAAIAALEIMLKGLNFAQRDRTSREQIILTMRPMMLRLADKMISEN